MAASKTIKVAWHEPSGQFKKTIGKHRGRDGSLKPKTWYLGDDERRAIQRAMRLLSDWDSIKASGGVCWPEDVSRPSKGRHADETEMVNVSDLTVSDIANLYLEDILVRAEAGQVSWAHYRSTQQRLDWVFEALGKQTRFRSIGEREIRDAVLFFAKRPLAKRRSGQKGARKPLSITSVQNCIGLLKAVCGYAYELDGHDWDRPKRFERLFKLKTEQMKTVAERAAESVSVVSGDVQVFDSDALAKIWDAARPRIRLYLLLGLNCGFTSGEISGLRTFEVHLKSAVPYIHRRRDKTGVEARWKLWPETAELLKQEQAKKNDEHRWLLTAYGNPLVGSDRKTRRDAVHQVWFPLVKACDLKPRLGFRFLRKTGGDAIKRLGGLEVSEMYLSHQEPGLNKAYANRDWDRMWKCLDDLRSTLPFIQ